MAGDVSHPFTQFHYRHILQSALDAGYRFARFDEEPVGLTVYLRHDVDNGPVYALDMARLEASMGIRSSYLILLRSPNYNPLTGLETARIREIARLGHAVGLHFSAESEDEACFGNRPLADRIKSDAALLEQGLGLPIQLFSFHNPGGKDRFQVDVPGIINTYSDQFFRDIKYLSESNFRWREGCPCDLFRRRLYPVMQLLIHPMTYAADLQDDRDALLHFLLDKVAELGAINQAQNSSLAKSPQQMAELLADLVRRQAERRA